MLASDRSMTSWKPPKRASRNGRKDLLALRKIRQVIGVSTDSWESHQRFSEKYGLEFALASDSDHQIRKAYGVGKMMGVLPVVQRVSFLVGPDGRIAHVWPHVTAARHAADVLAEVRRHTRQGAPTT